MNAFVSRFRWRDTPYAEWMHHGDAWLTIGRVLHFAVGYKPTQDGAGGYFWQATIGLGPLTVRVQL